MKQRDRQTDRKAKRDREGRGWQAGRQADKQRNLQQFYRSGITGVVGVGRLKRQMERSSAMM